MKNKFAIIAIALSTLAAGTVVQAAGSTYATPTFSTLTRAEVKADLAAWRTAGLADEWRGEQTPDFYSTAYRIKMAHYLHLLAQQKTNNATVSQ